MSTCTCSACGPEQPVGWRGVLYNVKRLVVCACIGHVVVDLVLAGLLFLALKGW